ncbi:MAG: thioredoxin domain-containing protein [Candidatus Zambryskibacteria bacterium]|nr:thioredoxin domain-containing protein [Candidatus Zambryskibacteria bacterium]
MPEKFSLPVAIILAALLIAGGIYLNGKINNDNQPNLLESAQNTAASILSLNANDHILGSANARILVIEYSDTECPFCKNFHVTMNSIMQEYGKEGEVAWVYRHFPLEQLHSKAFNEALATECADKLGGNSKFWEYINKLYEITPSNDGLDPKELINIATQIGLSSIDFNACLESEELVSEVEADFQSGQKLSVGGTPYNVIVDTKNGEHYELPGAYPYSQVKSAIDMILEN